ncbi:hypothetical protein DFH07DRAFT_813191 [Mycena maculata]|uniref:Signal sequence receptor subunit alpha n=1 Tax=Mycena maculata TaxID=230809 RepID=A0AAD7JHE4_9AGAR|nr:hypothetical protein DFH07DRAFT_813191 [Mycena maculata]
MRFNLLLGTALSLAALVFSSQVVLEEDAPVTDADAPTDPFLVSAAFPESNPFGHIVNGEKNTIQLSVENKSEKNITLVSVGGAVYNVQNDALIKNLTTFTFAVGIIPGIKMKVPYSFYSEFKPGDIRLNIWVDHTIEDTLERIGAYDSIVTVVEPEVSIFDFKMISTYIVTAALLGGLVYLAYQTFGPKRSRPRRKPAASAVSAPVGAVTATGAGGYQEEWIPEHHMRKPKTPRKKSGALTSGDEFSELSAGELSSPEKEKKGKGKGRK